MYPEKLLFTLSHERIGEEGANLYIVADGDGVIHHTGPSLPAAIDAMFWSIPRLPFELHTGNALAVTLEWCGDDAADGLRVPSDGAEVLTDPASRKAAHAPGNDDDA